jgi:IS30 family transposase
MLLNVREVKMIDMDKKEQIPHYHRVDGLSLREIARRTGLNRKTVTRYILARGFICKLQSLGFCKGKVQLC